MSRVQLHRALSKIGLCSRSQALDVIRQGGVRVNGRVVREPLTWVELPADRIEAAGHSETPDATVVLKLYKPRGVVTTRQDERGRRTVYDLLPAAWKTGWVFPVGRLDLDSEGLLLLTNDGVLSHALTDPKSHVVKTYRVRLSRFPDPSGLERMRQGMDLQGEALLPAEVAEDRHRWLTVQIREGKNRQIRRMFQEIGCKVERLIRTAIGPVTCEGLAAGDCRELTKSERLHLRNASGFTEPG